MKKSFLLFLASLNLSVQAQTVILDESLKNRFPESNTVISSVPSELDGWTFNTCYGQREPISPPSDIIYVQVGNSSQTGYVTTNVLSGIKGNALISAHICPIDTFTLNIESSGGGTITQTVPFSEKYNWFRIFPTLLRNGSSSSKVCFSPTEPGKKRFCIANIKVTDIDDAIFYESFDRCDGKGGNDGDFSIYFNYVLASNPKKADYFNYINQEGVSIANKCIYLTSKGSFTLAPFDLQTNSCLLTFKAGGITNIENLNVTIYYTDKTTNKKKSVSSALPNGCWNTYSYALANIDSRESITIEGEYFYLDEIKVVEIKELGIDEAATDVSAITPKVGKYVDAQLTRSFKKDIWNTCCLPFTVKASYFKEVAGDDLEITMLKFHDITAEGVFHFEDAEEVAAGEPFLLQVNKDITNPLFTRVKITADAGATKTDANAPGFAFKGILCKTALNTNHTDVFLGTDEELHYPTANGNLMRGMRAYFTLPEGTDPNAARISIIDSAEGISEQLDVQQQNGPIQYYDMKGQQVLHPTKGFYIVRSANGGQQAKKILVK